MLVPFYGFIVNESQKLGTGTARNALSKKLKIKKRYGKFTFRIARSLPVHTGTGIKFNSNGNISLANKKKFVVTHLLAYILYISVTLMQ
jgi:hypothetical protein